MPTFLTTDHGSSRATTEGRHLSLLVAALVTLLSTIGFNLWFYVKHDMHEANASAQIIADQYSHHIGELLAFRRANQTQVSAYAHPEKYQLGLVAKWLTPSPEQLVMVNSHGEVLAYWKPDPKQQWIDETLFSMAQQLDSQSLAVDEFGIGSRVEPQTASDQEVLADSGLMLNTDTLTIWTRTQDQHWLLGRYKHQLLKDLNPNQLPQNPPAAPTQHWQMRLVTANTSNEIGQPALIRAEADITGTRVILQVLADQPPIYKRISERIFSILLLSVSVILLAFVFRRKLKHTDLERQHLEAERYQIENRADTILASIEDALIVTNSAGMIEYINPRGRALLAHQRTASPVGKSLSELWPAEQALWNKAPQPDTSKPPADGTPAAPKLQLEMGDTRFSFEQSAHPIQDTGKQTGTIWLLRDITHSLATRAELHSSREKYVSLFENSGIAHWLLDLTHFDGELSSIRVSAVNSEGLAIAEANTQLGFSAHFKDILPGDGRCLVDLVAQMKQKGTLRTSCDATIHTLSGKERKVSAHFSLNDDNEVLVTLIDETDKKLSQELKKQQETFWRTVMAAMPVTVLVLEIGPDQTFKTRYHNRSAAEMLGYPPTRESHLNEWRAFATDSDSFSVYNLIERMQRLEPEQTLVTTRHFRHMDGSERMVRFEITPFETDSSGLNVSYIASARDVTEEVEKQQRVIESESRYRLLAENMTDVIWATDSMLNFTFFSSSVERLLGYTPDQLIRSGVASIFGHRELVELTRDLKDALKHPVSYAGRLQRADQGSIATRDMRAKAQDGRQLILEVQVSLLWNDYGQLQGLLGVCRDVTATRRNERELVQAADVFENTNEAIIVTNARFRVTKINPALTTITGFQPSDILGKRPDRVLSVSHLDNAFMRDLMDQLALDNYWQGEIHYLNAEGNERMGWAGISLVRNEKGRVESVSIVMSDTTERKVIEERIHRLAYFDSLTGLANRSHMHQRMERMIQRAEKEGGSMSLLFIDLDRFKPINDSLGHPAGDKVLVEVAERLKGSVKSTDIVSRIGGDEFAIAIGHSAHVADASEVARYVSERVLSTLSAPFMLDKHQVFIGASVGIAMFPHDGRKVVDLLRNADMAMYQAKGAGRGNCQFYHEGMNEQALERMELEHDLHRVLHRNELKLHYQLQYDSHSMEPVGAECLLRWNHPEKGNVHPSAFIPILEDTGLIVPVGRWVLELSCRQMASWVAQGSQVRRMGVNVSARQFKNPNFVKEVQLALKQAGLEAQHLELELTESLLIDDIDYTLSVLHALRDIGVRLAIDDFGTGYSSLSYLKRFPLDVLKIDGSFVHNLPKNKDDAQIVRTITSMAHNLGLDVVAEGVENPDQLVFLVQNGCEKLQGFLLSEPLPAEELGDYLTNRVPHSFGKILPTVMDS